MKNRIKSTAVAVKNHLTTHAPAYVLTSIAVAATMVWVETSRAKDLKEFLETKGIDYDEFVNPEFYAEKQAAKELASNG